MNRGISSNANQLSNERFLFSFQVQLPGGTIRRFNKGKFNVKRFEDWLNPVVYAIEGLLGGAGEDA